MAWPLQFRLLLHRSPCKKPRSISCFSVQKIWRVSWKPQKLKQKCEKGRKIFDSSETAYVPCSPLLSTRGRGKYWTEWKLGIRLQEGIAKSAAPALKIQGLIKHHVGDLWPCERSDDFFSRLKMQLVGVWVALPNPAWEILRDLRVKTGEGQSLGRKWSSVGHNATKSTC